MKRAVAMAESVCPDASRRRISLSRGVNEMSLVLVGGASESSASAITCVGVRARPAAQANCKRPFTESGAGGGHGMLQGCLVFSRPIAQPEPFALRPGRAQQPG